MASDSFKFLLKASEFSFFSSLSEESSSSSSSFLNISGNSVFDDRGTTASLPCNSTGYPDLGPLKIPPSAALGNILAASCFFFS